jgi:hypothetical protein
MSTDLMQNSPAKPLADPDRTTAFLRHCVCRTLKQRRNKGINGGFPFVQLNGGPDNKKEVDGEVTLIYFQIFIKSMTFFHRSLIMALARNFNFRPATHSSHLLQYPI